MKREQARRVMERIGVLRDPCDLDLLLFFVRHPRALLTSDQIASFLGYDVKRIGDSLDILLSARLLTRSQNPTHAARMYVFNVGGMGPNGGWLPSLVDMVSTRDGRLAMREALIEQSRGKSGERVERERDQFHRAG